MARVNEDLGGQLFFSETRIVIYKFPLYFLSSNAWLLLFKNSVYVTTTSVLVTRTLFPPIP